jgi:hypothetical protein
MCRDGWMDRQTDMTKLIIAFHKFANVPKKGGLVHTTLLCRSDQLPQYPLGQWILSMIPVHTLYYTQSTKIIQVTPNKQAR